MTLRFKPADLYSEEELASSVKLVERAFPEDIEHIRYTVHEDWSDDPAIFFRILLQDKPELMARTKSLYDDRFKATFALSNRIESELRAAVEDLHLPVYFAFRWLSEQREIKDPDWD